jgi:hypothetical protein
MHKVSADAFYHIGRLLYSAEIYYQNVRNAGDTSYSGSAADVKLNQKNADSLQQFVSDIGDQCGKIGLNISVKHCNNLAQRASGLTNRGAAECFAQLDRTIKWEMEERLFMFIPPERATFYGKQDLFGAIVHGAFPSARFDIIEAGNCYAAERATACVFHLMRVLEIGLSVLGTVFGVSLAHTNWAPAIDQIESKIREMRKDSNWKLRPDYKEQQEFYAQAASHFGVLKDAWRNYTAHARGKYTLEEAELLLKNIGAFMQKLATRLHE